MYVPEANERTQMDFKRMYPYLGIPHYEYHPSDKKMYRTHTAQMNRLAGGLDGAGKIVWRTTNWITGIPDENIMRPYSAQLRVSTNRFM